MTLKIIDNKRIEMTVDEYDMYKDICRAFDRPNFQGEELFKGHFETDKHGMITMITPPMNRQNSPIVHSFLLNIQNNQQLRVNRKIVETLVKEASDKIKALTEHAQELQNKLDEALKK